LLKSALNFEKKLHGKEKEEEEIVSLLPPPLLDLFFENKTGVLV